MTSGTETPVALIGTIAPTFWSSWSDRYTYRGDSEGVAILGTAVLISAAVVNPEGQWQESSLLMEEPVRRVAELAVARMVGRQDGVLAIGVKDPAPARHLGARASVRYRLQGDSQWQWLVRLDGAQLLKLRWLHEYWPAEPDGIIAWNADDTALEKALVQLAASEGSARRVVGQLAKNEITGGPGVLQSLGLWAFHGCADWRALIVGRPGVDPSATRSIIANTAMELGVPLYSCGSATGIAGESTPDPSWQTIPLSWERLC